MSKWGAGEFQSMPKLSTLPEIFGPIANGRWADEAKHMSFAVIPRAVYLGFVGRTAIYCNKMMADHLTRALNMLHENEIHREVRSYDGCFDLASPELVHQYGMAVALNADAPYFSEKFLYCFRVCGFINEGYRFMWVRRG